MCVLIIQYSSTYVPVFYNTVSLIYMFNIIQYRGFLWGYTAQEDHARQQCFVEL